MFQFDTKAALKGLLAAGIAAAALVSTATPASATAVFIDKAEMFNPATAYITGFSGSNYPQAYVYDAPVLFTANNGTSASSATFNFLGFCVDIYDDINVGINSPMTENLQYQTGSLVDNGAHGALYAADLVTFTQTQKDNISKLVNYGTQLWNADALTDPAHHISQTLINQLGGVQGAIWKLENPNFTVVGAPPVNGFGNQATVTANIANYSSSAFLSTLQTGSVSVVFDSNLPAHQAFAFASNVPEPGAWGLMILGFGGIGAVMRRRRLAPIAAAA